jgi:outer membrane protein assembly factor BamD
MAMNKSFRLAGLMLVTILLFAGCGRKTGKMGAGLEDNVEPDRVLLERSLEDIEKGRFISARLNLMTLINTYPDSEFLAKAKLAVADSYYKEGGSAGLAMAAQEYKDFRTFFPFLEEAAYAQYQVAMCHYRRLEKPDRDRTQARLAESEFQEFLKKHPEHEWVADAEQRLRNVQEVLAEGDYRIARHYYVKGSYRAAAGRLLELTDRYPLYSNSDRSLMMLGDIFEKAEREDIAGRFYSRVVKDYPLSALAPDAKTRLEEMGVPVPQPDPAALERMQKEAEMARSDSKGLFGRTLGSALGIMSSRPDTSRAARAGQPNMEPPSENSSSLPGLTPGQNFNLQAGTANAGGGVSGEAAVTPTSSRTDDPGATSGTATSEIPQRVDPKTGEKKEDKKKNEKESSSKKKKGLRKIIPW